MSATRKAEDDSVAAANTARKRRKIWSNKTLEDDVGLGGPWRSVLDGGKISNLPEGTPLEKLHKMALNETILNNGTLQTVGAGEDKSRVFTYTDARNGLQRVIKVTSTFVSVRSKSLDSSVFVTVNYSPDAAQINSLVLSAPGAEPIRFPEIASAAGFVPKSISGAGHIVLTRLRRRGNEIGDRFLVRAKKDAHSFVTVITAFVPLAFGGNQLILTWEDIPNPSICPTCTDAGQYDQLADDWNLTFDQKTVAPVGGTNYNVWRGSSSDEIGHLAVVDNYLTISVDEQPGSHIFLSFDFSPEEIHVYRFFYETRENYKIAFDHIKSIITRLGRTPLGLLNDAIAACNEPDAKYTLTDWWTGYSAPSVEKLGNGSYRVVGTRESRVAINSDALKRVAIRAIATFRLQQEGGDISEEQDGAYYLKDGHKSRINHIDRTTIQSTRPTLSTHYPFGAKSWDHDAMCEFLAEDFATKITIVTDDGAKHAVGTGVGKATSDNFGWTNEELQIYHTISAKHVDINAVAKFGYYGKVFGPKQLVGYGALLAAFTDRAINDQ